MFGQRWVEASLVGLEIKVLTMIKNLVAVAALAVGLAALPAYAQDTAPAAPAAGAPAAAAPMMHHHHHRMHHHHHVHHHHHMHHMAKKPAAPAEAAPK